MKKYLFAGNWKMNKTQKETQDFLNEFLPQISQIDFSDREIMIAPPFTALAIAQKLTQETPIKLGAQNACWAKEGAFTGEISPVMLKEFDVKYVILGHSERRHLFGETDEIISKRIEGVYESGLIPILCIGETLEERKNGKTLEVIERQLFEGLKRLKKIEAGSLVVAYEPVWAIGTGINATPEEAEEVQSFIRKKLENMFSKEIAETIRILYGGSVSPSNIKELMKKPNIDGVLVGGASLDPHKFLEICKIKIEKEACILPDYSDIPFEILEIPQKYKNIVIVGASPKSERPSYMVMEYLLNQGFKVIPINPAVKEILGQRVYSSLSEIPSNFSPEVIIIFRRSDQVLPIVEAAIKLKPKVIWMQEGIINEKAKELAEKENIKVVMNKCFKKVHLISQKKSLNNE